MWIADLKLLSVCCYANIVMALEDLVHLQAVHLATSLYPSVRYKVGTSEHQTSEMMVCAWSSFAGATATSQHIVQTYPAQCFTDLAGVLPLETDVNGAYLVSAAVVQRGAI
jgi:hypothetical protein